MPNKSPACNRVFANMKWYYNNDGKLEEVAKERWVWEVEYENGNRLEQYDGQGVFHRVGEINQSRIRKWILKENGTVQNITILLPRGAKIVHRYKRFVFNASVLNKENKSEEVRETIYVFGYKIGQTFFLNFVRQDGSIIQTNEEDLRYG